jgi:hypothetical protein
MGRSKARRERDRKEVVIRKQIAKQAKEKSNGRNTNHYTSRSVRRGDEAKEGS